MNVALWIIAVLLAGAFTVVGLWKLVVPWRRLVEVPAAGWARDFTPVQVKLIGLAEIAGAAGLILPPLLEVATWLVPLAAAGLCLDMLGAFSTHLRRNDPVSQRVPSMVLGPLALVVAVGRYFVEPF